jgi:hypothetical protein
MDDFDEVDEQNEEDLMMLGDAFGNVPNLKDHIVNQFKEFCNKDLYDQGREYLKYCIKQLEEDDKALAQLYLMKIINESK